MRRLASLLASAAIVITMSACSDITAVDALPSPAVPLDGVPAESTWPLPTSPLTEYLNVIWGLGLSQEEINRQEAESAQQFEETLAQCMREHGFQYVPNPASHGVVEIDPEGMWQPDNPEWVAQFGFGITVSPRGEPEFREVVDPNAEIRESLGEAEGRAYDIAMWGPPQPFPEDGNVNNPAFLRTRGCQGLAQLQRNEASNDAVIRSVEFFPIIDAINAHISENATFVTLADQDWAACMTDLGHPGYTRQWAVMEELVERRNALWSSGIFDDWDWETYGQANVNTHTELAELHQWEVEMALADLECRNATNFQQRRNAAIIERESQFVQDNLTALNALRDALEQRGLTG